MRYQPAVVGHYDFRCPELPSVAFSFPIFVQWEPRGIEVKKGQGCIVHLSWPPTIKFETARMVIVTKIPGYQPHELSRVLSEKEFFIGDVRCFGTRRNSQGVAYGFAFDPGLYVEGYKPPPGHWDYLHFYRAGPFGVCIWIHGGSEDQGFSRPLFVERVIGTFRFSSPTPGG